jgi:hypothetical protein
VISVENADQKLMLTAPPANKSPASTVCHHHG